MWLSLICLCRLAQRIAHGNVPEALLNRRVGPKLPLRYPASSRTGYFVSLLRISVLRQCTLTMLEYDADAGVGLWLFAADILGHWCIDSWSENARRVWRSTESSAEASERFRWPNHFVHWWGPYSGGCWYVLSCLTYTILSLAELFQIWGHKHHLPSWGCCLQEHHPWWNTITNYQPFELTSCSF